MDDEIFSEGRSAVCLGAAKKDFKPIYPTEELQIAAVVHVVIYKYG